MKEMIDFEIIWKSIHNLATEEEKIELENWLRLDTQNVRFYNKQKNLYSKGMLFHSIGPDIDKSWKKLNNSINRQRKNRLLWVSTIAASAIIIFAIFYFNSYFSIESVSILAEMHHSDIKPGSNKAVLILDDGTEYHLADSSSLSLSEGNTKITNDGSSIKYQSDRKIESQNKLKLNKLIVPRGGEFFIILSDSTKIWLNSETTLEYPVEFTGEDRIVKLEGEAFFEVTKSKKRFKVLTGEQVVEVLGTSFNISSYKEDSLIFTTLVEGKLNVSLMDNPNIKQVLLPNYQSYLYKNESIISVRQVDPSDYIAWKEGRFLFKNKTLIEIMNTLSRWYDVDITIKNEEIGKMKFTGDIKRYEFLENILTLIKQTNEITYEITKDREVTIR